MKKIVSVILCTLLLSGCATRIAGLTVVSDRNVNTKNVRVSELPQTQNVVGESKKFVFLFIPFGGPTMKEALEDALNKGNGDMMINASLYATSWWFIVGQIGYELRGTVVNTQQAR